MTDHLDQPAATPPTAPPADIARPAPVSANIPTAPAITSVGPVTQLERITSLDVLRGFALLGILVMNMQAFAMIMPAYFNPHAYGDLTGTNYLVWLLSHIFADTKFMSIFSMLFGAGIVLMAQRREVRNLPAGSRHYLRMGTLLALGMAHAYLIWDGDILVTYALCGMIAYPLHRLRPTYQLVIGLILIGITSLINLLFQLSLPYWPESELIGLRNEHWQPSAEFVQQQIAARQADWLTQLPQRIIQALFLQTFLFAIDSMWRITGLMLIGMALFRWRVLSAQRSVAFYRRQLLFGLVIALPLIIAGVWYRNVHDWDIRYSMFTGSQFNLWGSLPMALAWIGLIMLICRNAWLPRLRAALAAVGQTAFSNYLLQSLICTWLFNGYGLGLVGTFSRTQQALLIIVIWSVQIALSQWWLKRYRFGPAEWLWRSMTYGKMQPLRREADA